MAFAAAASAHTTWFWLEEPVDSVWQNPQNWDGGVPDEITEVAGFSTSSITAVTLPAPVLNQGLTFQFAPNYTFSGAMLSLDLYENPTAIGILAPDPAAVVHFQNPIHFFDSSNTSPNVFFQMDVGSSLAFSGGITATGMGLFISGFGASTPPIVFINGPAAATIAGTVEVNQVSDLGGDGIIHAPLVVIEGGLRPGASPNGPPAALTIEGELTLGNRSLAQFDLGGETPDLIDRVNGISNLVVRGTLHLRAVGGFDTTSLETGATFDLLDWSGPPATEMGHGFALDPTLASLPSGLTWEMSNLLRHGTVHVTPTLANLATGGTASASAGLTAENAFDGDAATSWTNGASGGATGWLQYRFGNGARMVVNRYTLVSSIDPTARDPRDWNFQASNDGVSWITLGTIGNRAGVVFALRGARKICAVANTTAYEFYRLNVSQNNGGTGVSLGELKLQFAPPTEPLAAVHLEAPEVNRAGQTVMLHTLSAAGHLYQLQRSGDLTSGSWVDHGPLKTGTGGWLEFRDAIEKPAQFYRLAIKE